MQLAPQWMNAWVYDSPMPYRVLPSVGEEVTLVFRTSYWLRLFVTLRAARRFFAILALVSFAIAAAIAWVMGLIKYTDAQSDSTLQGALSVLPWLVPVTMGVVCCVPTARSRSDAA